MNDTTPPKQHANEAEARQRLAAFSSTHTSEAVEKLGLDGEASVEAVLPTTCTQSQLALSFAMDRRKYISHTVLNLKQDVSFDALEKAIHLVISQQPIYRCALLPCDDSLSPFAQAILTPESWRQWTQNESRVVHRKAAAGQVDVKEWLDLAEANISLDAHKLYHIQIIEPDSDGAGLLLISVAQCICDDTSLELFIGDIARHYAGLDLLPRQNILDVVLEWASNIDPGTDKLWQDSMIGWEAESFGALSGNNVSTKPAAGFDHGVAQHVSELPWHTLEEKSAALGSSPANIIQAAWSLLLQQFTETDTGDVTFGHVQSAAEALAHAPTFSVLPCRVALPERQTVDQLLGSLAQYSELAQNNRHTSFGLFKTLPYNTALALHQPPSPNRADDAPAFWTEIQSPAIRYDVSIFAEVFPMGPHALHSNSQSQNMTYKLSYSKDVLSEISAAAIVRQLAALTATIMEASLDDMAQWLPVRLPRNLLSAEGTVMDLTVASGDQRRTQLLHAQFEDQAVSTPDRLALSFYDSLDSPPTELSYGELDARANGLAKVLREEDVEIIPICMKRSVELYVAILAILKVGSAWCPIDETSPLQRRTSLIARTKSKILLSTTESLSLVEPCLTHESLDGVRVILIDQYADQKTPVRPETRDSVTSSHELNGEDLAYLLWTSGTTGEPKGVMIQHRAATRAMRDLQVQVEHDPAAEQVRTLQFCASSFDVFVQDLFYTWGLAGAAISATRELMLGMFVDFVWKSRPTHAHLTPSFGASVNVEDIKGSTMQYVTFIGEKLTEDVAEAWAAPGITTRAYNTYGPAENAVVSTLRQFHGKSRDDAKAANVGFPLHHCTAYVVREVDTAEEGKKRWDLVPRYGVGELALGGPQVAKGYLSNEAKTTKAFIQGGPGIDERIYLTGDVVRLNDHGFEFLGRNDDLVKITGIRIELSEISAACATIKDEEQAVEHVETLYLQRPGYDSDTNNKVVVTFVSTKKKDVDTDKLRARVFQRAKDMLPTYMVPGHVVVLDKTMPRTASNKVDRKALTEIYKGSDLDVLAGKGGSKTSDGEEKTGTAWTEDQLPILQIIADHFKVAIEPLASEDSLAGLGFSSLQITKLSWSLRRDLQCAVGVLDLMGCQFLGELVDVVLSKMPSQSAKSSSEAEPDASPHASWVTSIKEILTKSVRGDMRPQDTTYALPATPVQESLVVETMREPGRYWIHRVFDLNHLGDIDGSRLKEAWVTAAKNFDILRTIFVPLTQLDTDDGSNIVSWARQQGIHSTILQLVRDEPRVYWTCLSSKEDQKLSSWAERLQVELTPTTTTQPPWAVTFAEGTGKLMLSLHHALYDMVASEIILDAVARSYQEKDGPSEVVQLHRGMELGLLPSATQRDEAASVWSTRLADVRATAGALNGPFPDLTQSRQKQPRGILLATQPVPPTLISAASGSPSLPTLLQSAFGCVLASYLELKAIVLGQTISQRILHPDLATVMGPAMATVPVVVRADALSAEELWSDMASDTFNYSKITHNLHPVDMKKLLNQGSDNSQAPFPGLFVYHPATEISKDSPAQQFFRDEYEALSLNVEHPLALKIFEDEWVMELTGDGRMISQSQLDLLLNQVIGQAHAMMTSPQLPLDQLQNTLGRSLISISGEATSPGAVSANPADGVSFHASEHPDWVAVEEVTLRDTEDDEDEVTTRTVTYADLEKLVNAISSKLASHTPRLQPDDTIGLYMSRDIKSLAATLAIFKSGHVYLPVDEDLPSARKQLLIRDAKAKLIITTEELVGDLQLNPDNDPPALLLPDGDGEIETIMSWPVAELQSAAGEGGYLIYTSGSTGRPKGVRVSNSNLCHFITAFSSRLIEASPETATLGGSGKYLNLTSRAFDPHLTQMFVPWHLGHRVVIGKDRTAMLGSMQRIINELAVTHFGSVPSVLTQLRLRPDNLPSVRVVTTGGEKASSELLNTWSKERGSSKAVLFNFYGPTEATIGCLGHAVNQDSNARNLGLPLEGLEAILLSPSTDGQQIIARRGQPGELCIAGPQVALGYLDRPLENAKAFQVTSLLGGEKKIYRTGDMMRMMHDGTLEFLGRADQQAKIRGQRLELNEVVSFLKQAAAEEGDLDFSATVVANGPDPASQQQRLLGFVARKPSSLLKGEISTEVEVLRNQGQAVTMLLERIRQKCEAELPAFMIPELLWVSKIPYLVASGKVDTKLLSKLASDFFKFSEGQTESQPSLVAKSEVDTPLNATECLVVAAVEEAVGSKVNATTASSLHRLGIDSLSAVHLVSILRKKGLSGVTMANVLSPSSTVGSISSVVGQEQHPGTRQTKAQTTTNLLETKAFTMADLGPTSAGLDKSQIEAILPCLPLQSALVAQSLLWLSANDNHDEDGAETDVPYVSQFRYRLSPGTDILKWTEVAQSVIASEAMLRTCFVQRQDGQVFQVVLRSNPSVFEDKGRTTDIVAQMSVRAPIRLHIEQGGDSEEAIVLLKIHHALFDGVAIDVLRRKIQQAYQNSGNVSNPVQSLNALTAISNHCNLTESLMESTRHQWEQLLVGVRPCRVGANRDNNHNRADMVRSTLCLDYTVPQLKSKFKSQAEQTGLSISASSAFQLATSVCLASLTGQASVAFGFVTSLRPLIGGITDGVDDFIGPCLNTLIHTITLQGGNQSLIELTRHVDEFHRSVSRGTMPLVSAEKVQRWAHSEDKLFDSLLSINVISDAEAGDQTDPGRMHALPTRSKSDMALAIDVDLHADGRIMLTLSSAGILSESQLGDVGRLFEKVAYHSADEGATVEQFVPGLCPANTETNAPKDFEAEDSLSDEGYLSDEGFQDALSCVQVAICRLLDMKISEVAHKPKTTTLYQIGIDSITVLPLVKFINKSQGIKISPDAVIKARSIQGVVKLVQAEMAKTRSVVDYSGSPTSQSATDSKNGAPAATRGYDEIIHRIAQDTLFVATPLQEGMLSASLAINSDAYIYTHTIQLSEKALHEDNPSLDKFFAAVKSTVQACEILRTRFIFTQNDDAPWVGVVSPSEQSDLVKWEMVKSQTPGIVQLRIHHALYDANSIRDVWRILSENYNAQLGGVSQQLEESTYLFRPFAKAVALAQTASLRFWNTLVQGYSYQPLDFSTGPLQASSAFHFTLEEHGLARLQTKAKDLSVTTKAILQLAWAKVLCESIYGQPDIVYGQVVSTASGLGSDAMVGPAINTVPMRITLANDGAAVNFADALARVQELSDDARGENAMASLRNIQSHWRSDSHGQDNAVSSLFQSLFVFDGVIPSTELGDKTSSNTLFNPIQAQLVDSEAESGDGPAYDDYPLITSFQIKGSALHGKLRAKMSMEKVQDLGHQLEDALREIIVEEPLKPALDSSKLNAARERVPSNTNPAQSNHSSGATGSDSTTDAVLAAVVSVLSTRSQGKAIGYNTKLVNAGVDSILAIRLSKVLKKQLGIRASVFEIINGATAADLAKNAANAASTPLPQMPSHQTLTQSQNLKSIVAKELGLSEEAIKSIVPALAGQRAHLEQWLFNGKRFLEAPWVYRLDNSLDLTKVESCWSELCRVHEALRTTFVSTNDGVGLLQVTLDENWAKEGRVLAQQDPAKDIDTLINEHVAEHNYKPSDLKSPPAHLSFLEASDGKAIVIRIHHALYDAWSIKMIEKDLDRLLAGDRQLDSRESIAEVTQQIDNIRSSDAELSYWKQHLSDAQDTVLRANSQETPVVESSLGPHFKLVVPDVVPQSSVHKLAETKSNARTSSAILLAYARTLGHFTKQTQPTFGLHHASRSLSSADGTQTLDLTSSSVPTLSLTPFSLNLQQEIAVETSDEALLDIVQAHLAQLTKFAQSEGVHKLSPKFNSYVNILYPGENVDGNEENAVAMNKVLIRHRLPEPLASDYFTSARSSTAVSTVENLDTSHLCPRRLFFNVIVRQGQDIKVTVSGDEGMVHQDNEFIPGFVSYFGSELARIIEGTGADQ